LERAPILHPVVEAQLSDHFIQVVEPHLADELGPAARADGLLGVALAALLKLDAHGGRALHDVKEFSER
jgi:hypothetical protein